MPRPRLEAVGCHEHTDEDGNGKRDKGSNGANTEECACSEGPAKDEEEQDYADAAIDDDGVDGCAGAGIDGGNEFAEGKHAVSGVGEGHPGGGDHAALAHREASDDGKGEDGESDILRQNLQGVCGEGLPQVRGDAAVDVDNGVGRDEGEEPAELWRVVSKVQLF